jgi:hypothetical protein
VTGGDWNNGHVEYSVAKKVLSKVAFILTSSEDSAGMRKRTLGF